MNPTLAAAILTAVEELLKLSPALIVDLQLIFAKQEPTADDWAALKAKVNAKSYWDYVKDSALPRPEAPKPDL